MFIKGIDYYNEELTMEEKWTMENGMRELSVFIDESGNTSINNELYICAAFMLRTSDVDSVLSQIQGIAQKYGHKTIKNSQIRSNKSPEAPLYAPQLWPYGKG